MEDYQVSHIEKHLPKLIKNTRCTTLVKSLLLATENITEEEVEILTAAGDNHGAKRETKLLYDILKTRLGAYEALMEALEETRQTGALDILKAGQEYRDTETSKETMVQQLMKIPVELFGSVQCLQQHFPGLKKKTVLELLNDENVKRELVNVVQNHTTLKLTPELPELHALYIPRAISNRLLLDPTIFKRNCPDIFVFKGVQPGTLVDLVSPHVIRMSTPQRSFITCRHIHLDDDEDWDDLVLVTKAPLHLVFKDTDGYMLQRSTEVTSILHEHWLHKSRKKDAYLSEEKFVSQFIDDKHGKGALVCDVPGMGKSWLMQSITRRIRLLSERTIVFFIQLDSLAKYLAEQHEFREGVDSLHRVFQFANYTKLAGHLLSLYAGMNYLNVVLVFDGFDEVSHVHIENLTLFLKNLSAIKHLRFIISSRPNMRAHLEQAFNLISFDILPFGKVEQVSSIVNRWQETILEKDDKKLTEFAVQCIDSFKVIRQTDKKDILGIPLQCYLLAVVNETTARQVCKPNRKKEFVVHDIAKVESICQLYTQFFDGLIHKRVEELNASGTCNMQTIEKFHTYKALELLFPEIAPVFLNSFEIETGIEDFAAKLGVLCKSRLSELEFIHRSFAEFLAGKYFAEFWMDLKSQDPSVVQSVGSYFIRNVMKPGKTKDPEDLILFGRLIYYKYDEWLRRRALFTIPRDVFSFCCSTVLWFMNALYRKNTEDNDTISIFTETLRCQQMLHSDRRRFGTSIQNQKDMFTLCKEKIKKIWYENIISCLDHGFSSLLCLLVSLMKAFFKDTEQLALLRISFLFENQTDDLPFLLCYIAAFGCHENASEIFGLFSGSPQNCLLKCCLSYPDKFWTPLEVAIERKNLEMVLFFNQKVKKNEERLLHVFLERKEYTNADMNVNIAIMETVFGSASKFFSFLSLQKVDKFHMYVSMVNVINLAWACKCSLTHALTENKKYVLKRILERGTDEELMKLLLLLFPNGQNKRFFVPDEWMTDFSFNIREFTGKAVLQNVNLDGVKMALPNDFYHISQSIRSVETLKILIGITPNLSSCNTFALNYLHEAARFGKVEWVEHLIECGYDIGERNKLGNTPLHCVRLDYRGVEMTQMLVNNGADASGMNNKKRNFAHNVCSRMSRYWSKDKLEEVPRLVKYLMEVGFREIWKKIDSDGNTPLDLLSEQLGTNHPITQEILTLLQTERIFSSS